jgi:DNA polymerase III epsilon subunit-like protein
MSKKLNTVDKHVSAITDTLQIAREKHPGQRNSLDALVNRYEVGGYDRELHGALLDSKILGDVYLAMTGGQSTLDFTSQNEDKEQANQITSSNDINLNLTVVNVTKEEHQLHLDYLERMKEETGTIPVWLSKDS